MSNNGSDSLHSDYALVRVPDSKRTPLVSLAAVWVGWAVSISGFLVGGIIADGTTVPVGLSAILVGNLVLVIMASLIGVVGFRTGFTTSSVARIIFGKKGSILVSALLGLLMMGFIGVLMSGFGSAFNKVVPSVPTFVANVVFAACITWSAIYGMKGLSILSRVAAPILWAFLLLGLFVAYRTPGSLSAAVALTPTKPIGYGGALSAVIATWVTGAIMCSDIARYAQKEWHIWAGAAFGYVFGSGLYEAGAMFMAKGAGSPDIVVVMGGLGLLIPGVIILLLALWTTTDNNVYSFALSFTNLGELLRLKISKPAWTIIAVLIALAVSLLNLASRYSVWLGLIGLLAPPFGGIVIAHFWVLNFKKRDFEIPEGYNFSAYVAWVGAALIAKYVILPVPAPVVGLVSSIVIHTVLGLIFRSTQLQSEKSES